MTTRKLRRRATLTVAGLALGAGLIAGCGSDDEGDGEDSGSTEAATLAITASDDGPLEAPESAEAGLTEITLTNDGEAPHSAQLIKVEGEHEEQEVADGLEAASSGEPFPEWFFAGGGTGTVSPGETATVTQELEPGFTYWATDDEAEEPVLVPIEVTGEGGDEALPESENTVSAVDFAFETEGLTAGEAVTFKNEGEQPHHMVATPIIDDEATIEDVEAFFKTEKGPPPVDFEGGAATSVLEGGTEQISGVELEAGRYALVCFISNREGGPPHVALGMIDEVEVE